MRLWRFRRTRYNILTSMPGSFENERQILKRYVDGMPTFSPATAKIVQLANDLNAPAAEIIAAIRLDPVLTGKVLQLVNSAYFSLAQKVTSLNRALVYLGINTIKNLALSSAVMDAIDVKNKELAEIIKPTWKHSLATAVCAKGIAKAAHVPQTHIEEFFIAGLLHRLGQIILIQAFHSTNPHNGKLSIAEERERYGLDHSVVGAETLKRWKFSDALVDGISAYHSPTKANTISCFVHVANAMTYMLKLHGEEGTEETLAPAIAPEAWEAIGLNEAQVIAELQSAPEQIEKAEVFLNISGAAGMKEEI